MHLTQEEIKQFDSVKTPFYYYRLQDLRANVSELSKVSKAYNFHVHYALKANANVPILKVISEAGLGADCVSGNEILRALECGFNGNDIAFAGVGKTDEEINIGLKHDIFSFNVESVQELQVIDALAGNAGKKANIALRINPDVNANTHKYITTGLEENKFGINRWELEDVLSELNKLKNVQLKGLHFHIGSQITDLNAFKGLCLRVNEIQHWFIERGIIVEHLNLGGGLGIDYKPDEVQIRPDYESYFSIFHKHLQPRPSQQVHFELGRSLVAYCGHLITRVLFVKNGINTNFAIVDAGMTELIRPALYQSVHPIVNLSKTNAQVNNKYDVVGPVCESSDCFGKQILMPDSERGDFIDIQLTGAYGEAMVSEYNLRERVQAIYSK